MLGQCDIEPGCRGSFTYDAENDNYVGTDPSLAKISERKSVGTLFVDTCVENPAIGVTLGDAMEIEKHDFWVKFASSNALESSLIPTATTLESCLTVCMDNIELSCQRGFTWDSVGNNCYITIVEGDKRFFNLGSGPKGSTLYYPYRQLSMYDNVMTLEPDEEAGCWIIHKEKFILSSKKLPNRSSLLQCKIASLESGLNYFSYNNGKSLCFLLSGKYSSSLLKYSTSTDSYEYDPVACSKIV
ncbi:hypothetical protein HELRODRAFT_177257 [Helobdella robusta]|uniref:Uncharacterized protein n=1 Tax=Helobdella robusta TaxID=6412 RepID=T1FBF0_HELRO|nr:hypothetical protein HELRODRAFT_177257 [Helobdella robusta]ESN98029.1 hypothetical protein HELRODRAFT_177257 [Helobdella robusta]